MPSYFSLPAISLPAHRHSQQEILQYMLHQHEKITGKNEMRLRALYRASAIGHRYSVLADFDLKNAASGFFDNGNDSAQTTPERMEKFNSEGFKLANAVSKQFFDNSDSPISHLIYVSCTGLEAPGIDIQLLLHHKISEGVQRFGLQFMGCYAALPALRMAKAICESEPEANVLVVCLELCTLHFRNEDNPESLLANALFGDGAAAVLVSAKKPNMACLQIGNSFSALTPDTENLMAWQIGNSGFEMRLSDKIPSVLREAVPPIVPKMEQAISRSLKDIAHFAIHPGGKGIVEAIAQALELPQNYLVPSLSVLKEYGNMSSPTVLFVLERIMHSLISEGSKSEILALAFGPGLSFEAQHFIFHPYD
jgi:alpha-pyrone synthase